MPLKRAAVKPMAKCIFCDSDLDDDSKPEHILLNALGGRKTSRVIICNYHNEKFGSTIDKALADQVQVFRNMLHLESGTGNAAPMLRKVKAGDDTLNIKGDGTLETDVKPFILTDRPDGTKELQIQVRSAEHLSQMIPHIAAALKISEDSLLAQLKTGRAAIVTKRPDVIRQNLSFGGADVIRSMVKSCLELWATQVGNDEVRSNHFAAAREFVLTGNAEFLGSQTFLDARPLPHLDKMTANYGEFFNLIYIRSDAAGRVVAHFTLYNIMGWQMVLAESGGTTETRVGLVSNPESPSQWSDKIADEIDIEFSWLNAPERVEELTRARARLEVMAKRHLEQGREREINSIIATTFERYGLTEISVDTDEKIKKLFIGEISQRVAKYYMRLPDEQRLEAEDIDALIDKGRSATKKPKSQ